MIKGKINSGTRIRNPELRKARDLKLLRRFYEMTEINHQRFDYSVKILSEEEFFIQEKSIWSILKKNAGIIEGFRKEIPGASASQGG